MWKAPEPADSVTINNAALTCMAFDNPTKKNAAQHLAVGDSLGTMHVMLLPPPFDQMPPASSAPA